MATTGQKSETSIKNYTKRCRPKCHRKISDLLSNKLNDEEPQNKIVKKCAPEATVSVPPQDAIVPATNESVQENRDLLEMDCLSRDSILNDKIIEYITHIEKQNSPLRALENTVQPGNLHSKVISFSQIQNVSNFNKLPNKPAMYFPNSTVNINCHFHKN